jgi:exonuclease VII small subunit
MIRKTTSTLIRTTIVWFTILFSILGPLSDSIVADICRAEPLRLTLTAAALQDIQFRWGTFDEAMRVARALRWEIPIGEQKVPAFTALDQADASIFWMGRQMYALQLTATVTDVILKIILESVRENRVRLEAAVAALQDGTAQKTALKQKLNEAGGYLLELTQSLNQAYRSAAWGNVNQLDRQVTVPRRITLLDSKPASLTLEAPVGGAVRVNIACEHESGGPLQVSAQLRNLFDSGGDDPIPPPPADSTDVTIQTSSLAGRATMFALELHAVDTIETQSLNPCLILVTQDSLLAAPPEPITPQENSKLAALLTLQTQQLTELRDQARRLLADPESLGSEDVIIDVLASQVSRVNQFSKINALSEIKRLNEELTNELDSLSELGEVMQMRLQMSLDRLSKLASTMSNLLQKISATQSAMVSNLK